MSENVLFEIDPVCERFEDALRLSGGSSNRPSFEEYLKTASEPVRDELFRHLLEIEIEFLQQQDSALTADDYVSRFPSYESIILAVFEDDSNTYVNSDTAPMPFCEINGEYRLIEQIGRGGMGVVYRAIQIDLDREVALKQLFSRGSRDAEELSARFSREAEVTAKLDHPSIVPVFAVGQDNQGHSFYTMRLVRGRELKTILQLASDEQAGWNQARAVGVLIKIGQAIAYAHSKGVVHRDLKPSNVMVGELGEVYVMDWGLAKIVGHVDIRNIRLRFVADPGDRPEDASTIANREVESTLAPAEPKISSDELLMTMDGAVIGTPAYMPPEQAKGDIENVDHLSDIYSLGAILYQLLAGQPPYFSLTEKKTPSELLDSVIEHSPIPIATIRRRSSPELTAICEKAMSRDRSQRYQSALEFVEDLQAFLDNRVVTAYQTGAIAEAKKWIVRNRGIAASVIIALLLGFTGVLTHAWLQAKANSDLAAANAEITEANQEITRANEEITNAYKREKSAKKREVEAAKKARSAEQSEKQAKDEALATAAESYVNVGLQEAEKKRFAQAALWFATAAELVAANPKHQYVHRMRARMFAREAVVPLRSLDPKHRTRGNNRIEFDFSDQYLLTLAKNNLAIFRLENGELLDLGQTIAQSAELSPVAHLVAISFKPDLVQIKQLPDGTTLQTIPVQNADTTIDCLRFSADGRYLFIGAKPNRIWDVEQARWLGGSYHSDRVSWASFNANGKRLLTVAGKQQVSVFAIADEEREHKPIAGLATEDLAGEFEMPHSKDKVALPDGSGYIDRRKEMVLNKDGEPIAQFGTHASNIRGMAVSSSGRLAASSHGDSHIRLWRLQSPRPWWFIPTKREAWPVFSHDGRHVIAIDHPITRIRDMKDCQIQVYDTATGNPVGGIIDTQTPVIGATFSDDGEILALACSVEGRGPETFYLPNGKGGTLQFWDWQTGMRIGEPILMPSEPRSVCYHPDGNWLAVGCAAGHVLKVDPKTQKVELLYQDKFKNWGGDWCQRFYPSGRVTFDNCGDNLISWGFSKGVCVWDVKAHRLRYDRIQLEGFANATETHDNVLMITGIYASDGPKSSPWFRKLDTGEPIPGAFGNKQISVVHARLDQTGQFALCSGEGPHFYLYKWSKSREAVAPNMHVGNNQWTEADFINRTPFLIAGGGFRGTPQWLRLWDRSTGRPVTPNFLFPIGGRFPVGLTVTRDGHFAAMEFQPYGVLVFDLREFFDNPMRGLSADDFRLLAETNAGGTIEKGVYTEFHDAGENGLKQFRQKHPDYHQLYVPRELAIRDHLTRAREFEIHGQTGPANWHRRKAERLSEID